MKRRFSQRRACRLANLNFSTWQYRARRKEQPGLRERIKELAGERRRFGYLAGRGEVRLIVAS